MIKTMLTRTLAAVVWAGLLLIGMLSIINTPIGPNASLIDNMIVAVVVVPLFWLSVSEKRLYKVLDRTHDSVCKTLDSIAAQVKKLIGR